MTEESFDIQYGKDPWQSKGKNVFFLPHSCDEWVIGDMEDAKRFLRELQELISKVESEKVEPQS